MTRPRAATLKPQSTPTGGTNNMIPNSFLFAVATRNVPESFRYDCQGRVQLVSIAAAFLNSNWSEETKQCVYRDDAAQDHYICNSSEEMVELYDLLTSNDSDTRRDAYSLWCSQTTHDLF